ncbi:MAG: hypothetical protein ABI678_08250 [Kofleriaceae bacterium]
MSFIVILAACASAEVSAPGDAAPPVSTVPTALAGTYDLAGTLDLQTLPAPAVELLDALGAATDQPDDPARYLVDRMVAALPAGTLKAVATGLAPYIAPYIQVEIDRLAPRFAPGIRQLASGLATIGHHMTPIERMIIARDGLATRALIGLQFGPTPCDLAANGAPDALAIARVAIDGEGKLALAGHKMQLPYGEMLRLGLDRAVIPSIDLSAGDLADALRDLVDCHALGATFSEHAGLGSPALYETACVAAMTGLASDVYRKIAAIDDAAFVLDVSGTAVGVDLDGDGAMDEVRSGAWTGTATYAGTRGPLGVATFTGTRE